MLEGGLRLTCIHHQPYPWRGCLKVLKGTSHTRNMYSDRLAYVLSYPFLFGSRSNGLGTTAPLFPPSRDLRFCIEKLRLALAARGLKLHTLSASETVAASRRDIGTCLPNLLGLLVGEEEGGGGKMIDAGELWIVH